MLVVQVSLRRCHLEMTDWIVVPGAWVPNPPNADGCTPVAFWGLGFGKVKALFAQAKASTSLGWGPLKFGRLIANASQAVPLFEPQQTHTLKGWPGHRLVNIGSATRPSISKWQFQNSFLFFLGVWVKLVALHQECKISTIKSQVFMTAPLKLHEGTRRFQFPIAFQRHQYREWSK